MTMKGSYQNFYSLQFSGIQGVATNSVFVSHFGYDFNNCGNWTMPCHTLRHAVEISHDGDRIYIDYAQGKPYKECENEAKSAKSIDISQSISFHGLNGKAEIRCKQNLKLFKIRSSHFNTTCVQLFNVVISSSSVAFELEKESRMELIFENTVVTNNHVGIRSQSSADCSIKIFNSSFLHHIDGAIRLKCFNLTLQIISSTFKKSSVMLQNVPSKPAVCRWIHANLLVRKTDFDGENTEICADLFSIMPYAALVNITILDSTFKNHYGSSCLKGKFSTLSINDHHSNPRTQTFIILKKLVVENNSNRDPTVLLIPGNMKHTFTKVEVHDSILRNNSKALWLSTNYFGYSSKSDLIISLINNTFADNFCTFADPNVAAAVLFSSGRAQVYSSRFFDNRAGQNLYKAVIKILEKATVDFHDCYFENRQTEVQSNQLFASGSRPIKFLGKNTFNLIALKERQSVFVHIPTILNSGAIFKKDFKILCPQGYKIKVQQQCSVKSKEILCYYINIQCERCPPRSYTLERGEFLFNKSNDIQCQQCPRGGVCDSGLVTAKPNFWGYKNKKNIDFVQCPPGYCCDSSNCITYNSCHGNRSGTLCGRCARGMSESLFSAQCISNTDCSFGYHFIIGAISTLIIYLVFFLYHREIVAILRTRLFHKRPRLLSRRNERTRDENDTCSSGIIKIFFYYYQVCNLIRSSVGLSSTKNWQIIYNFEQFISMVTNMVLVNLPSFNCPLKHLHAVRKNIILHSMGYVLLALVGLLHLISKCFPILRRLKSHTDTYTTTLQNITTTNSDAGSCRTTKFLFSQRVASAFTYISLLMYASSAQLCLNLLHCVPVGDDQVLFLDGNIKCYQTFQYFFLAYLISSILPFSAIPILGSYLLKFGRIGVKQFCTGCIFPLPFCCFWSYLMLKEYRRSGHQRRYNTIENENNPVVRPDQSDNETQDLSSDITFICTDPNERISSAILKVLLSPFRSHNAFKCFPASQIPWEGFLIFRRLVLIIILTFVYDIQLKLFLTLISCVAILFIHMVVNPFQRKLDNLLESSSLSVHVILCGSTLIKAFYSGEDNSFSKSLPILNLIEDVFIVGPISFIAILIIFSVAIKLASCMKCCVFILIELIRRLFTLVCRS